MQARKGTVLQGEAVVLVEANGCFGGGYSNESAENNEWIRTLQSKHACQPILEIQNGY